MSKIQVVTRQTFAEIPYVDRVPDLRNLRPQPVSWTVNSLVPARSFTIMAGGPGQYKSWIGLDMAIAIATGGTFANLGTTGPRPVLYIDRENSANLVANRLQHMGLTGSPALQGIRYWGAWTPLKFPGINSQELLEWAKRTQGFVVFDSLVRFHAANENDNSEMAQAMGRFIELARAGASVLVLHHTPKDSHSKFRGAQEILAACDVAYKISKDPNDRRLVTLDQIKNRVAEERVFKIRLGQNGRFEWED